MRIVPGRDPDSDAWLVEGGPFGTPPSFICSPERQKDGWQLVDCSGGSGARFSAFVSEKAEGGIQVTLQVRERPTITSTLTRISQRDERQASDNVSLLWHQPGRSGSFHSDVWAADGLVFAPKFNGTVEILDAKSGRILSVARLPESEQPGSNTAFDVKAAGGMMYVATGSNGLVIFDVSEPESPERIGQYHVFVEEDSSENFTDIHNIFLSPRGSFVYAINHYSYPDSDMRIIDVSDPTSPREAGRFELDAAKGATHDINVVERNGRLIAFLNYLEAGLWTLDVTDPASVFVLGSIEWDGIFSHSGWPFALDDRLYYAHASEGYDRHLTVLDMTDLAGPVIVSHFRTRAGISIHNMQVVDGIAYISYYIDGLRVVDLRNPESPIEVGHYDTVPWEEERGIVQGAFGVRVLGGVVYLSDFETGTYAFHVELE